MDFIGISLGGISVGILLSAFAAGLVNFIPTPFTEPQLKPITGRILCYSTYIFQLGMLKSHQAQLVLVNTQNSMFI